MILKLTLNETHSEDIYISYKGAGLPSLNLEQRSGASQPLSVNTMVIRGHCAPDSVRHNDPPSPRKYHVNQLQSLSSDSIKVPRSISYYSLVMFHLALQRR